MQAWLLSAWAARDAKLSIRVTISARLTRNELGVNAGFTAEETGFGAEEIA